MDFSFVLMYGMMHGRVRDVWLYNKRFVCIFIHYAQPRRSPRRSPSRLSSPRTTRPGELATAGKFEPNLWRNDKSFIWLLAYPRQ
jgi:hypothetical protein